MAVPAVSSMEWSKGQLLLLDQRKLPARLEHVACSSAKEVAGAIRAMVVRGAPAIACAAAYGLAAEAHRPRTKRASPFRDRMEAAFRALADSRPTAANLFWALARMRAAWQRTEDESAVAAVLLAEARAIHAEDVRTNRALGAAGARLLPRGARVLTYCNTGALATGGHGTALGVVRSAVEAGNPVTVLACETRPYLQGARLTAWELVQERIPVTVVTDNAAGHLMARGEVDVVIVGADRVAANGDVANKIGTYMLAVLARRHGLPFCVACPVSTVDPATPTGAAIPIEERNGAELAGFGNIRWTPSGVALRYPAFDVTPAELVSALITERGVVRDPDAARMRMLLASRA